jgi:hypothetical protein
MSAKTKLKSALSAIDNAKRHLRRLLSELPNNDDVRRAIRYLDDAESDLERGIREARREAGE